MLHCHFIRLIHVKERTSSAIMYKVYLSLFILFLLTSSNIEAFLNTIPCGLSLTKTSSKFLIKKTSLKILEVGMVNSNVRFNGKSYDLPRDQKSKFEDQVSKPKQYQEDKSKLSEDFSKDENIKSNESFKIKEKSSENEIRKDKAIISKEKRSTFNKKGIKSKILGKDDREKVDLNATQPTRSPLETLLDAPSNQNVSFSLETYPSILSISRGDYNACLGMTSSKTVSDSDAPISPFLEYDFLGFTKEQVGGIH